MRHALVVVKLVILSVWMWMPSVQAGMIPIQPVINYQGRLDSAGTPHTGTLNMVFRMYNGDVSSNQIGDDVALAVDVHNGLFSVDLDFGPNATWNEARYLEIEVGGQILTPRQVLRPAPFALNTLGGSSNDFPDGVDQYESRFYSRPIGDIPVSPSRFTIASVRADGSNIPELRFHAPFQPGLGDPGSVFSIAAGGATFGTVASPVNLGVRGTIVGFGNLTVIGSATFQAQAVFQNLIGMGTQTPGARLHVVAPGSGSALRVQTNGGNPGLELASNGRVGIGRESGLTDRVHILASEGENALRVQNVLPDGGNLTAFRVFDNSGISVGANVSPPGRGLYVHGHAHFPSRVGIGVNNPTSALHVAGVYQQDGPPLFRVDSNLRTGLRVTSFGSVAVGNVADSGIPINGGLATEGGLKVGQLHPIPFSTPLCIRDTGSLTNCSSSAQFKEQIETLVDATALIEQLRPVSYRWIEDGLLDVGLIAEEVEAVDPRLVTYDGDGELVGVKFGHLTGVLVGAFQEQRRAHQQALHDQRLAFETGIAGLEAELQRSQAAADQRIARLEALLLGETQLLGKSDDLADAR